MSERDGFEEEEGDILFSLRYTLVEVFLERYECTVTVGFLIAQEAFVTIIYNTIVPCHSRQDKHVISMKYLSDISLSDHHNTRSWRL